ncbi:hypothetical protein L596_024643 [Steinernema carpocapsae]|uniref:Uncharacterized protein n=1 Tax=Steinernema carpocapsae TaxID=34508 RepID=A0A4U5M5C1_STECR|nr:hypothetical protein L596_024643 [Steinernema carpocapsae]
MGRHKRMQTKKRNTLKSVDPFNKDAKLEVVKEKLAKKRNDAPKANQIDDQVIPKAWVDVNAWKNDDKFKKRSKKKNKNLTLVEQQAMKLGEEKRSYETTKRFVQRITAKTYRELHEEKDMAKFAMAGRDRKEVEEDTKQMDEELKRKKAIRKEQVANLMANRRGAKEQKVLDKKAAHQAEVAARKAEVERQKRAEVHKERRKLARISKPKKQNPLAADRESVIEMYRQMKKQKPAGLDD